MNRSRVLVPLIPIVVALVFCIKWLNCLPALECLPSSFNTDQLDAWFRYLIFSQEAWQSPFGVIQNLAFPSGGPSIDRGLLPLFALLMKMFVHIGVVPDNFYYFTLAQTVFVFVSAALASVLVKQLGVEKIEIRFLSAVLVGLSFPMLFYSAQYHGLIFVMAGTPVYLLVAVSMLSLAKKGQFINVLALSLSLGITSLLEPYSMLGAFCGVSVVLMVLLGEYLMRPTPQRLRMVWQTLAGLLIGIFIVFSVKFVLYKGQDALEAAPPIGHLFSDRLSEKWGYGGGLGGGFHVADVVGIIVPPSPEQGGKEGFALNAMGFDTDILSDGQYEGFSYIGISAMIVWLASGLIWLFNTDLNERYKAVRVHAMNNRLLWMLKPRKWGLPFALGVAAVALYLLSWGYILHIFGVRFNYFPTPSFFLALAWPDFQYVRSMGRLAVPFSIFMTLAGLCLLSKLIDKYQLAKTINGRYGLPLIVVFLAAMHIFEVSNYIKPIETFNKKPITDSISFAAKQRLEELLEDRTALLFAPEPRRSRRWLQTVFSIAYQSHSPSNIVYGNIGQKRKMRAMLKDIRLILSGQVTTLFQRYGAIAIVLHPDVADQVIQKLDAKVDIDRFDKLGVVILRNKVIQNG